MTDVKIPNGFTKVPYSLDKLKKQKPDLNTWLKNIETRQKPVDLPTNLFDNRLCCLLKESLTAKGIQYTADAKYNELFKRWWHEVRKDDTQAFYRANREYNILDEKVCFKLDSQPKFSDYYQEALNSACQRKKKEREKEKLPKINRHEVEVKFKKTLFNTEKEIRILQEEDCAILLMLENFLQAEDNQLQIKLSEAKTLLSNTVTIKQKISGILDPSKNTITKTIIAERKRKDFSILYRFNYDKRIPELFEYFDAEEIPLQSIRDELNTYTLAKQLIFDKAFELEITIIKKDPDRVKRYISPKTKFPNIQHYPYLKWLKELGIIDDNEYKFLGMVRNKNSHNQFPPKETMELFIKEWQPTDFALQIYNQYALMIDKILEKI